LLGREKVREREREGEREMKMMMIVEEGYITINKKSESLVESHEFW
jgi:hypothetical protein